MSPGNQVIFDSYNLVFQSVYHELDSVYSDTESCLGFVFTQPLDSRRVTPFKIQFCDKMD